MKDLWRQAFPFETQWEKLFYEFNWDFSNLKNAFEEGGVLHGKKVFIFLNSEPVLVFSEGKQRIVFLPAVIVVELPFPPSDKIGIASFQWKYEEIVDMNRMKLNWVPYIPLQNRERQQIDGLKSQIFILSCTQPMHDLKHLNAEDVKKLDYCMPYFYNPLKEDEFEQITEVDIIFTSEQKEIERIFKMGVDQLDEFVKEVAEEEELSEDQKYGFEDCARKTIREVERANREAEEARNRALENMDEETRLGLERMKLYKFYPLQTLDTPDISDFRANKIINRYYGNAHVVL